jgi:hypothetical protein
MLDNKTYIVSVKQDFSLSRSNACSVFSDYLSGKISIDEFRKAKIVSDTVLVTHEIKIGEIDVQWYDWMFWRFAVNKLANAGLSLCCGDVTVSSKDSPDIWKRAFILWKYEIWVRI